MGRNNYHKCLHIDFLQKLRDKGEAYICLKVAGSAHLVLLCPECFGLVKLGNVVAIRFYGGRNEERGAKRYYDDCSPVFFELTITYGLES